MNINKVLDSLHNHNYNYEGNPVLVRFQDMLSLQGMDTVEMHMMYRCPETDDIARDSFVIARGMFELAGRSPEDKQVLERELYCCFYRFVERIRMMQNETEYEMDEIEI